MAKIKENQPNEPGLHWGWLKTDDEYYMGIVGSLHGSIFLYADKVIDICRACNLSFYLITYPDLDGNMTAAIKIMKC